MGAIAGVSIMIIFVAVLLVIITALLVGVFVYGYRNPTTGVGQLMIKVVL